MMNPADCGETSVVLCGPLDGETHQKHLNGNKSKIYNY